MFKLVFAAAIYHVCLERNAKIFRSVQSYMEEVPWLVVTDVRACLSTLRKVKSGKNQILCSYSNIASCVFSS